MPVRDVSARPAAPGAIWLTPYEVAHRTGFSYDTVINAMRSGEMTASQHGRRGRWTAHVQDVDAWMRGERNAPVLPIRRSRRSA